MIIANSKVLAIEVYIIDRINGRYVFNTEYGHLIMTHLYDLKAVRKALTAGILQEWVIEGVEGFDYRDTLLTMFVLDELISKDLPHYHTGIYLRYLESIYA